MMGNLEDMLKESISEVVFEKVDGTERTMLATLHESYLPEKTSTKTKKVNEDILPVWDVEKKAWRSFRRDSVISIKPIEILK